MFLREVLTLSMVGFCALAVLGCGRSAFTVPTMVTNPPPAMVLAEFSTVELQPMTYIPEVTQEEDEDEVQKVANRITEIVQGKIQFFINKWNSDKERARTRGKLVIQPVITQLKWVTRGERIWAGAMYGNSAIEVRLNMTDEASGTLVHNPMLFSRANAMSGAWGMQDDAMLNAISDRIVNYIIQNYETALGGPTGVEGGAAQSTMPQPQAQPAAKTEPEAKTETQAQPETPAEPAVQPEAGASTETATEPDVKSEPDANAATATKGKVETE